MVKLKHLSIPEVVKAYIGKVIDLDCLKIKLSLLPDLINTTFTETLDHQSN